MTTPEGQFSGLFLFAKRLAFGYVSLDLEANFLTFFSPSDSDEVSFPPLSSPFPLLS